MLPFRAQGFSQFGVGQQNLFGQQVLIPAMPSMPSKNFSNIFYNFYSYGKCCK